MGYGRGVLRSKCEWPMRMYIIHTPTPPNQPPTNPLTPPARPQRRNEEALVVESDKGAHQAVVALPRGDPGVGAGDAAVDLPLLLDVRVLHQQGAADLGLAAHLVGLC